MANDVMSVAAGALTARVAAVCRPAPYQPSGHALAGADDADPLPDVLRSGLAGLTVPAWSWDGLQR